jgi:membrane-associated phospholipid phosphatase
MTPGIRPLDRLLAAYNAALAGLWMVLIPRAPFALWVCVAHAAAATMPWLLKDSEAGLSAAGRWIREHYALLFLLAFWSELGFIRELLHASNHDGPISRLDLALFGLHLNAVWMPRMPSLWFSEPMHLAYWAYYLLIIVPPIALGMRGNARGANDMLFRLLVTYIACYVIYIAFPVDGPAHTMARYVGEPAHGFFYQLVHSSLRVGDSMGTAFPSSHVAGAVTIAYAGWRWFSRPVALLLLLEAVGVILSTVYVQNHFAIDSAVGLVLALGLQWRAVPALARWLETPAAGEAPVPVLARRTPAAGVPVRGAA